MKKAQAAMEFLMTYGWAILVVLVAIGALAYFGVLSPEQFLPEKCVVSSGSGLFCDDFTASSADNSITVRVKNILAESVTITAMSTDTPACTAPGTEVPQIIAADSTEDIKMTGCTLTADDKIKADLSIEYSKGTAGLNRTTTGSLVTKVP